MEATLAIFNKEFKSFFYSPIAYLILAFFTVLTGLFFYLNLSGFVEASMMEMMRAQQYRMAPRPMNVNLMLIRPYFWNIALIALFTLPAITMRLYSEEKRLGTVELLYTVPITPTQIISGKFLAGLALFIVMLIPTMIFHAFLFLYGEPEFMPILSGYIGLILLGSAFIAVGLFISTTTENQIIAAIGGLAVSLILWLIGWGASYVGPTLAPVLEYVSIITHYEDFSQGIIDTGHLIYYILFTFTGLYFALKMIESVKWRA
ncbi:MAG: ABC transporter permease subunit [Calditrichaceae bacterium]|nr:ABC transporter permease subunit [Calditrichaceae bacterium]MBN2707928.1 ABC transporter permease subunit [Calditrichaceae bacterium]RQV95365.1 MAG: ABC transporter permease [Calditrichota bacterium]